MSGLKALVKATKAARKGEPFYSAVDEAAASLTRGKGTGKEFMIEVLKKPGVKPTEIKERGLQKIETMPKMTKEEFLAELEKRPAPQVEEKILRDPTKQEIEDHAHSLAYEDSFDELRAEGMNRHEAEDIAAEMAEDRVDDFMDQAREELMEGGDAPYHGNYTIAGGQNYREMLLKMPAFKDNKKLMELESMRRRVDPELHSHRYNDLTQQIDALKAKKAAMTEQFQGLQQHFGGEPGILASIRVSDRTGPKGEKVLHVEEIQSDWHQQGRKKGYAGDYESEADMIKKRDSLYDARTELVKEAIAIEKTGGLAPQELIDRIHGMNDELRLIEERKDKARNAVPDAPFKKNWHELAMKRVLNYAAENGYDRVAITPGAEQADRYNLAKHIDELIYSDDGSLYAAKDGKKVLNERVPPEKLEEYVGKDVAEKLMNTAPNEVGSRVIGGLDLQVGGEGMKGFYDKMLPDYLNSYGKKYGVQVTPFDVETKPSEGFHVRDTTNPEARTTRFMHATDAANWRSANNLPETHVIEPQPAEYSTLHSFEITPEMRQDITGKGMPLYQQIGIPTGGAAAGMGALEQEDQGFAVGGSVGSQYDTTPDMSDGGQAIQGTAFKKGGRVHLSQNPDTMLLDLMSRN